MSVILSVKNLKKRFNLEAGFFAKQGQYVYAVNNLSFDLEKSASYGIVGESGCGKSTSARMIVKMYDADSGNIEFFSDKKIEVNKLKGKALKEYRQKVKYVFQDPAKSLNPRMTVYEILISGLKHSSKWPGKKAAYEMASKIIEEVGLTVQDLDRRPADFSGGQRQRISIARALLLEPEILICDEVVSALDVSIQGQILNLLHDIRSKHNLSMLFITHDLKVACYFCDRIGVMYRGELMEEADAADLYKSALHPYTKLLFQSLPEKTKNKEVSAEEATGLTGEVKKLTDQTSACPFCDRCPECTEKCLKENPPLRLTDENNNHKVRCWNV